MPASNQSGTDRPQRQQIGIPGGVHAGQTVSIQADTITATITANRKFYVASGRVQLELSGLRLSADHMTFDSQSGEATADGHVAFDYPAEQTHIEGTRASYNVLRSSGEFDDFHGVSGIRMLGRRALLTSNNPLIFSGRELLRLGPNRYRLLDGSITSCTLPNPKWLLSASRVEFELGANASLHHAVFRLFDVPVFYAPFLTHSTSINGRHAGILVPIVSHSNIKGYVVGDSFYWPAARNLNLTLGGEYYSARGWGDHLALESDPTRNSSLSVQLDGVFDRGRPLANGARLKQGGQELLVIGDHESSSGFRSVVNVDYLSSYLYRLVFKNNFAEAINSEAVSTAFTERQDDGRDFAAVFHRYQDFLGANPHASLSLAALPSLDWNAYAQALMRRLPIYFSWDFNSSLLDRTEPGFATGLMERMDLEPTLTLPVPTPIGMVTGEASVRSSYYSERQDAATALLATAPPQLNPGHIWRNSVSGAVEWRPPALEKVFASPWRFLGSRMEHVFEPQLGYHYTGGVSDPNQIIRFDQRDIVANTSEIEYGFTNRLLTSNGKPGESRQFLSWTLLQKYYFNPTFSGALVPGARNIFLTTELLSPFDIEALPLRFSPLSSVLRVSPFSRFDGEWRLDYDSHDHRLAASAFTGNFHFGKGFFSGSHYLLHPPPSLLLAGAAPRVNQLRLSTGYGNATAPGFSLAGAVAYDARSGRLQYTTVQLTHNWDCCGFSVEYRRFSLATLRRENQFLVSFNLANVGTFGNLKAENRLF